MLRGHKKKTFSIVLGKYVSAMSLDKARWTSSSNQTRAEHGVKGGPGQGWDQEKGSAGYHAEPHKSVPRP